MDRSARSAVPVLSRARAKVQGRAAPGARRKAKSLRDPAGRTVMEGA